MHFIHRPNSKEDTIAAIATPPGEGAIAVIRVSGPAAIEISARVFSGSVKKYQTHTVHYGKILAATGETLDTALLLLMKGPRSYTGEDTVEISCHGGSLVARKVLARIFEAGARPAQPGEFSQQAFLNGKLDLAQAEAVQELISAKSEWALSNAEQQLAGALSLKISAFQKKLTEIGAILEAWVDFPEEGLEFAAFDELIERLEKIHKEMEKLRDSFHEGRRLHEGISLCLLGAPNVGKSSLMNALLGKERAIVTDIAGTTRDLLEEDLQLGGLHFRLVDTAGIRETEEKIEQEGIRRSRKAMQEADLLLLLLDASRPLEEGDLALLSAAPKAKTLVVWNKIDIGTPPPDFEWGKGVAISAMNGVGIEELKQEIDRLLWKKGLPNKEEVTLTKLRHHRALTQATEAVGQVIKGLRERVSAEFVASDMRVALEELGTILGVNVTEEILDSIFSQFCLGK
jgi:tRNA modification GTPase